MKSEFIITCPACGYTFKQIEFQKKKRMNICPMCGYKFTEPNILPEEPKDFDKRYI